MNTPTHDVRILDPSLERLANFMDDKFHIFGYRFGLNLVLELIPIAGDVISTSIALYIFSSALKYKLSYFTIVRMLWNIAVYFFVGLFPIAGDLFAVWWKPNRRNLELVRKNLISDRVRVFEPKLQEIMK